MDADWVPAGEGYSLYLRPTAISTTPSIGVAPPRNVKLFVIASPCGPYYKEGFVPVKVRLCHVEVAVVLRVWTPTGCWRVVKTPSICGRPPAQIMPSTGVAPPRNVKLFVIASPCGPCY